MSVRSYCFAVFCAVAATGCRRQPAPAAESVPDAGGPFVPPEGLVLAETSEIRSVSKTPAPRYPTNERARGIEGGFAVVYVVDTAGVIQYPSIAFSGDARPAFRESVCEYLRGTRLTPIVRDGRPAAALVVRPFEFGIVGGRQERNRYTVEPLMDAIRRDGIPATLRALASQPHCPGVKS